MDAEVWINYGFAAMVAIYVLTRLEPAIKQLNRSVQLLTIVVAKTSGMDYHQIRDEYLGRED